jgi:hypothetical protein
VLGYGLLAKTSTVSSKSKNRTQLSGAQNNLSFGGLQRELRELTLRLSLPDETHLVPQYERYSHDSVADHGGHHAYCQPSSAVPNHHIRLFSCASNQASPILPFNLLQQNPVLLI